MLKHSVNFNVRFDQATRDELDAITKLWRCSAADTLRRLVRGAHSHIFKDSPSCADGGRCFVPHMHVKKNGGE